ncbi:hypothetical protein [Dactylosporangium salmoneum]|uniref:Uncharacterized protein n=1 Tax=Dactylosporangium salmoneum TaxID=53361 RepID=A0ABP5V0K9_9ACTN
MASWDAGDRLRPAGAALLAALLVAIAVRLTAWYSSGFVFGPALGGLTLPIVAAIDGKADYVVPAVGLVELAAVAAPAVVTTSAAIRLLLGLPMATRRLSALCRTLLGAGGLHLLSVLAALPVLGLKVPVAAVLAFGALSLLAMALVVAVQRAAARTVTVR